MDGYSSFINYNRLSSMQPSQLATMGNMPVVFGRFNLVNFQRGYYVQTSLHVSRRNVQNENLKTKNQEIFKRFL